MSNGPSSSRLPFAIASFIASVIFGAALGAFLAYVVLPPDLVLRDAPPAFLRADPSGATVEYRDLYVARVAQRYSQGVQGGSADPAFVEAQESLGVASGDASPAEALGMASSALQAAGQENQRDSANGGNPDAGRFTLADENNIRLLVDRLTQIQGQPAVIPASIQQGKRNAAIFGVLGLAVLGTILVLGLWLFNTLFGGGKSASKTVSAPTTYKAQPVPTADGATATFVPPASVDELPDPLIDVRASPPTEPGLAMSHANAATLATAVAAQPRAASPVAGESLLSTFTTTFVHGDDTYDEGFQINSTSGELIGECGSSIVDRFGMERPSRVVALGVWVFDKNDFQSTKRVLMTPFAFHNPIIREKLAKQGDPVQAALNIFEVLTSTLRVEVEVRNLVMQKIDDDPDGYFERVDLEFRVFKRPL